ncbi:hypothetical protein ISF_05911 [Cordyceps fumosorosea ARSEF 2679]|uniref:Uncharacterized protein n=1 Tax=Cordyceps fumosorosea (strain ARSEF 2679) TaxID=1081104 RepID=A0A167TRK3_CORFA|nr:hypothetical protein ISF_05911 [Cordyceps fumosorosea ARSEF 2679]OAA60872.1 hypothetical protein ISF_05911 [Cordyceps fumosorosea ARSEF 2679]
MAATHARDWDASCCINAIQQPQTPTPIGATPRRRPEESLAAPPPAFSEMQMEIQAIATSTARPQPLEDTSRALPLPMQVDEQPRTKTARPTAGPTTETNEIFPLDVGSSIASDDETVVPTGPDPNSAPNKPPSTIVSGSSRDERQRHATPKRSAQPVAHQMRRSPQQHQPQDIMRQLSPITPAPAAAMAPVRTVMMHWRRLWQHPRQLYRHLFDKPLFRRAGVRENGKVMRQA